MNSELFPFDEIFRYENFSSGKRFSRIETLLRRIPVYPPRYAGVFNTVHPDIIHVHFGDEAFRLFLAQRKIGVPRVVSFYGYDLSELPKLGRFGKWRLWLKVVFRTADLVLAEGPFMRARLIELGCPPSKVLVHHLGVDLRKIPFIPRRHSNGDPVRLLLAASFREKKGIPYALEALDLLLRKGRNLQLVLVGDGPMRVEIENAVRDRGQGTSVTMTGYLSHAALLEVAKGCHIVLAPSVTASTGDTEGGAPVFLIEAQAGGMPAVATSHADIPQVVIHGKSGFLVPERDTAGLARAIESLMDQPECWVAFGEAARRNVETSFAIERQVLRLEDLYWSLLRRESH